MSANPLINQVPVMIGGDGREEVYELYTKFFLPRIPADAEMVPVSGTIGPGRLVNEMIFRFTHTISMDWMLPGIPPTGQASRDSDGSGRAIWRGQDGARASVLGPGISAGPAWAAPARKSAVGAEAARSVLDRSMPLNALIHRAKGR
jgi:carboxymethylenebutenolidase